MLNASILYALFIIHPASCQLPIAHSVFPIAFARCSLPIFY